MGLTFHFEDSTLKASLANTKADLLNIILAYAESLAVELEGIMKTNKPWTDRTTQAKVTLFGEASQLNQTTVRITLGHGVEYGVWLELAHEKNWAIVKPTLDQASPEIVAGLQDMMSKIIV